MPPPEASSPGDQAGHDQRGAEPDRRPQECETDDQTERAGQCRELIAAKKLGRKSGAGFYTWTDGKAQKPPAPTGAPPADLIDRLILVLVNECTACLREHVVDDPDLIDAAVIFGTGFAPFRGGPLAYARSRGVASVVTRLEELAVRYGPRFQPDSGWPLVTTGSKT